MEREREREVANGMCDGLLRRVCLPRLTLAFYPENQTAGTLFFSLSLSLPMELAFPASLFGHIAKPANRLLPGKLKFTTTSRRAKVQTPLRFQCVAYVGNDIDTARSVELERSKYDLLTAIQDTQRGLAATPDQRASIEESLVCVEGYNDGSPIDLVKLDGTWRLQYTSASDVLILLEAARLPFFEVGQIFQKFECKDQSDRGVVRNVVRWSIPTLLEENEGATLLVSAKFSVVSKRNIYLQFEEVGIENINISEQLQALIAPAILPRTFLSLQVLQFIQTFKAQFPLRSPERRSVGGIYYLSYLDGDMLLGRAIGGGGVFVFTRAQPLHLMSNT